MNAAAYLRQLKQLLPPGVGLRREAGSVTEKVLQAIADELERVDGRAADVVEELDPRTTSELLDDWERVWGLPDPCVEPALTEAERRDALVAKIVATGGQSIAFFIEVAAAAGITITITEFEPFHAGSSVGEPIYGTDWQFAWQVNAPATLIRAMECGDPVGDPLRDWGDGVLECLMERLKPAHTVVLFAYG